MQAEWFDGRTAKAHDVTVSIDEDALLIHGTDINNTYPAADVRWPERTRTGSRILQLPDGSSLHAPAGSDWNALARQAGIRDSAVVRWQQSLPRVLTAMVLLVALGGVAYLWGAPLITRVALAFVPTWVDEKIGEQFLETVGDNMLRPTTLDETTRARLSKRFDALVAASYPAGDAPTYQLRFHKSQVGPNAFALPGGFIIMTDELVELADNDDMVLGVLAHELGHVTERHGMRMVGQTLLIGTVAAMALGDYAGLISTVPLLLGQMAYSRDFERESDEISISMLLAAGIPPSVMADFFRKLEASHQDEASAIEELGIMISSHPATRERIERFESATQ